MLRARAEEHEARLRFGAELTALTQDEDGVTATIVDRASGRESSVRSLYVVAADGNASGVRTACGIGRTGSAEMGEFINIFHRTAGAARQGAPGLVLRSHDGRAIGAFVTLDGDEYWIFHLNLGPGERPEDYPAHRCADIVRRAAGVPDPPVEIISVKPWIMGA